MSTSHESKPWYVKRKQKKLALINLDKNESPFLKKISDNLVKSFQILKLFQYSVYALLFSIISAVLFIEIFRTSTIFYAFCMIIFSILGFVFAVYLLFSQIGAVCKFFAQQGHSIQNYKLGYLYLTSKIEKTKPRTNQQAAELILKQFVQQVRLYSIEKNYFLQKKSLKNSSEKIDEFDQTTFTTKLLDRRWQDVQDTLDEFDIYLPQNSHARIQDLLSTFISQHQDVSQVFQETAELFESTWRPKGVYVEHAIVVPLHTNIHEKLLKRLLAGPWRSCVYFAPKGGTVTFSVKSENSKIFARWACLNVTFSQDFYETISNTEISVDERIEIGMTYISNQPQNSNMLFGLISLIIWHDLAKFSGVHFKIKQGNDGIIITLSF